MVQGNETEEKAAGALRPGMTLAGRYHVNEQLGTGAFTGVDEEQGSPILALELPTVDALLLKPALQLTHAHLAPVWDLLPIEGEVDRSVLITERVAGTSLADLLAEIGKKSHVDAVRSALRAADALCTLHATGGAHGGVNAQTLIVQPYAHPAPTLTYGPRNPKDSPYRSPGSNETPSEADDSWATAALLYQMLTGHPPPATGIDSIDDLDLTELDDPELCEALAHGLASDPERRSSDLRALKRELARWFVDHAGEEIVAVSTRSSQPPPLPAGTASTPPPAPLPAHQAGVPALTSSMPTGGSRRPARRISLLAGGGILLGLAVAWGFSFVRNRPRVEFVQVDRGAEQANIAAPASAKAIDLSEVPVTGESRLATGDKLATCVAGYLPKAAFVKIPDLAPLCTETDPRTGGVKLRSAVVAGSKVGAGPTEAMKLFSQLGWYEMAAYAVIRSGCCPDAKPMTLPEPSKGCEPMDAALRELGKAVVNNQSYEASLKMFSGAIDCEIAAGKMAAYSRTARPQPSEASAFAEFIKTVQSP